MQSVKINKENLLATLRANRESHREIFLEAQGNYRVQVIAELDKMLEEAKAGKRIRRSVALVEPIDQTREYDRAIKMLEMSVDTDIELSAMDFRQFVMDEWSWKQQFLTSNMAYSGKAAALFNPEEG